MMPDMRLTCGAADVQVDGRAMVLSLVHKSSKMPTLVESVTVKLREMIINGEIRANSRVQERDLAEAFAVSRTPVRLALGILESEGLVKGSANRGFVVSEFSKEDILGALDVRGALEGFAVRTAIEKGIGRTCLETLASCIEEGRLLVGKGHCRPEDMRQWALSNGRFHNAIVHACKNAALTRTHAFLSRMPMVAPIAILFTNDERDDAFARMEQALGDHIEIFDAIQHRQGSRAEALLREHVHRSRVALDRLMSAERGPLRSINYDKDEAMLRSKLVLQK